MGVTEGAVRKLILKAEDNLDKLHSKEIEAKKLAQDGILQSARKKVAEKKILTKAENEALNLCLLQALFGKN